MKNSFSYISRTIRKCSSSVCENDIRKPFYLMATPGKTCVHILFYENGNENKICNYQYSLDSGKTYHSIDPPQTLSPITIEGLTSGTTYDIVLRGINNNIIGPPSSPVTVTLMM
jgi:hypothetical protein